MAMVAEAMTSFTETTDKHTFLEVKATTSYTLEKMMQMLAEIISMEVKAMIRSTEQERPTFKLTVMEAMISLKVQIGGSSQTSFMEMTTRN